MSSVSPATSRIAPRFRVSSQEISADVFLVELKAAAVDVVAEFGLAQGAEIVLAANDVVPLSGHPDLDEIVLEMSRIQI